MKSQSLFSGKIILKNINNLSSSEFAQCKGYIVPDKRDDPYSIFSYFSMETYVVALI